MPIKMFLPILPYNANCSAISEDIADNYWDKCLRSIIDKIHYNFEFCISIDFHALLFYI